MKTNTVSFLRMKSTTAPCTATEIFCSRKDEETVKSTIVPPLAEPYEGSMLQIGLEPKYINEVSDENDEAISPERLTEKFKPAKWTGRGQMTADEETYCPRPRDVSPKTQLSPSLS